MNELRDLQDLPLDLLRASNVAPISFHRCPVHKCLVLVDGERQLLGRCPGCASEAARGILILVHHILVRT